MGDRKGNRPRSCECLRIVYGHFVLDASVTRTREALDRTQIFAAIDALSICADAKPSTDEIGGLDYEGVASLCPRGSPLYVRTLAERCGCGLLGGSSGIMRAS